MLVIDIDSYMWIEHPFTILQLQITVEFHRQLIHQHHLQSHQITVEFCRPHMHEKQLKPHLQCGTDPSMIRACIFCLHSPFLSLSANIFWNSSLEALTCTHALFPSHCMDALQQVQPGPKGPMTEEGRLGTCWEQV